MNCTDNNNLPSNPSNDVKIILNSMYKKQTKKISKMLQQLDDNSTLDDNQNSQSP